MGGPTSWTSTFFLISKFSDNLQIWGLNLQLFTIVYNLSGSDQTDCGGLRELGPLKLIFDSTAEGVCLEIQVLNLQLFTINLQLFAIILCTSHLVQNLIC